MWTAFDLPLWRPQVEHRGGMVVVMGWIQVWGASDLPPPFVQVKHHGAWPRDSAGNQRSSGRLLTCHLHMCR